MKTKRKFPSLGETGRDIYQNWKALRAYPGEVIEGCMPGEPAFAFSAGGEVEVCEHIPTIDGPEGRTYKTGYLSTVRKPTEAELDSLHEGIDRGWIQIEGRKRWGALGVMPLADAGKVMRVYHQATGYPLAEWAI